LNKGSGCAACAGIEDRNVLIKASHEVAGFGIVVVVLLERVTPGGKVIPAGAAGGLWVGRDHVEARADEIVPILDLLRIAFAYKEDNRRGIRRAFVGQTA